MTQINRRELILGASGGLAATLLARPRLAWSTDEFVTTETRHGKVRGIRTDGVDIYRGVPYGGPVSGRNRFKPAPPPASWGGVRDALMAGPPSIQPQQSGMFSLKLPTEPSENCLTLTVWTPTSDTGRRPVMLYNHGGGFTTGSAASPIQDGAQLARLYDVVVVATNHRLGLFGYLYLGELGGKEYAGSGNQGMLDIVDGLKWISRNIEAFGGDPNNVMVFGESGGGAKTSVVYAMPSAAKLFNKASIESGPGIRVMTPENAASTTRAVLTELDIAPTQWRKLLEVPSAQLLDVQMKLASRLKSDLFADRKGIADAGPGYFGPVLDGKVLLQHPFDPAPPAFSRNKPLLVGYNHDENDFFALVSGDIAAFNLDEEALKGRLQKEIPEHWEKVLATYKASRPDASPADLYCAIRTSRFAGTGSTVIAERKTAQGGAPAYQYIFSYRLEAKLPGTARPIGAMHGIEIPFKFDNVDNTSMNGTGNVAGARPERIKAGRNMSEMWATFARTGKPGAMGEPTWPAYTLERRETMAIDSECKVIEDPWPLERKLWEEIG
jgi:para-nitrobenzyl esterase